MSLLCAVFIAICWTAEISTFADSIDSKNYLDDSYSTWDMSSTGFLDVVNSADAGLWVIAKTDGRYHNAPPALPDIARALVNPKIGYCVGELETTEALLGDAPAGKWTFLQENNMVNLIPFEFGKPGYVLAHVRVKDPRRETYTVDEIYCMPAAWTRFVQEAWVAAREHKTAPFIAYKPEHEKAWLACADHPNPVIGMLALDALLKSGERSRHELMKDFVANSRGLRQAVFSAILLRGRATSQPEVYEMNGVIVDLVRSAKTPEDLHGIGMALSLFRPVRASQAAQAYLEGATDTSQMDNLPIGTRLCKRGLTEIEQRFGRRPDPYLAEALKVLHSNRDD